MRKNYEIFELTFENLDWIVIPAVYIQKLMLGAEEGRNFVGLRLSLKPETDRDCATFIGDVHFIQYEKGKLFTRLHWNDITSIKLIGSDEGEEEYPVSWEDEVDDEFKNRLQTTTRETDGSLTIRIGAGVELWTWKEEAIL